MDQQIWQWTLTKEAIAPCFVRDVLDMRQHTNRDADFFWLGYTPCRTVLLVGMVVAVQIYDKRSVYTIDDSTAVIDCVFRHPRPTHTVPAPRSPQYTARPGAKTNPQPPSPEKARLGNAKPGTLESMQPPPPITEPGYPVRIVGRVVRYYQSKQIYADTIDPCPSSLDEIAHLERVIELHKTKYSRAVPFVPPTKPALRVPPLDTSIPLSSVDADASIFSSTSPSFRPGLGSSSYTLPAPPPILLPLQNRNRPPPIPIHVRSTYHRHTHVPSSPTASIASSTPSSPCKPSSPVKAREASQKPKLRHPSRLHTRDLTANTFRLYVKHYMDNAPPPFLISCSSPSRSTCGGATIPTKCARDEDDGDEPTPRPHPRPNAGQMRVNDSDIHNEEDEDGPKLGFTLSHLRRVPELTLLAARVVRAEVRKRDKADREKERGDSRITSSALTSLRRPNGRGEDNKFTSRTGTGAVADPPRKKIKRLFSWAVVKLYEEGSIVLWDGDVRPLPVPPPPVLEGGGSQDGNGLRKRGDDTLSTVVDLSRWYASVNSCASVSVLYTSSASAPLYSHYHAPRWPSGSRHNHESSGRDVVDADADPAYLSDPPMDEEAYIPLTPRFLAEHVREALGAIRRGRSGGLGTTGAGVNGRTAGTRKEPMPGDVLAYMQRTDTRWARLGVWAVEGALALLKTR